MIGAVFLGRWISLSLGPGTPPAMGSLGNHPATTEMPVPEGKKNYIKVGSFLPASEGKTWQRTAKTGTAKILTCKTVMEWTAVVQLGALPP